MNKTFELIPMYDSRKSFYNKARVTIHEDGTKELISYNTTVCALDKDNNITWIDYYSQTTSRHINEFLQQYGHGKMTKREMISFGTEAEQNEK